MNVLTLDLGNSALKLVNWDAGEPRLVRCAWGSQWQAELREHLQACEPGMTIGISSVVAAERREAVAAVCREGGMDVHVNPEAPLDIDCLESHSIGRDRLYAAAGAWLTSPEPAIVVDAGSALTVDALGRGAGRGCFLGGAIAPGPALLARALGEGATQLFEVEFDGPVPALGRNTRDALRAGVQVGLRGAVLELVRCVAQEAGLGDARVWLTGGASEIWSGTDLFGARRVEYDALLVHRGLLASIPR